jgi:tRNA G18 (ribose-2'-O)-methylase SpoU
MRKKYDSKKNQRMCNVAFEKHHVPLRRIMSVLGRKPRHMQRGYCGIGIIGTKNRYNTGTLWRSALGFNADFIFTIKARWRAKGDRTDTTKSSRHIPLFHFDNFQDFKKSIPKEAKLIGVELTDEAVSLEEFNHPRSAIYLLGPEDGFIPKEILQECDIVLKFNSQLGLNVAVAGSIVLYDRHSKALAKHPEETFTQRKMQGPNEIKIN